MKPPTLTEKRELCEAIVKYSAERFWAPYGCRALAMYLVHIGLGQSVARVAEAFDVDPAIASAECAKIDDALATDERLLAWCDAAEACTRKISHCRLIARLDA